MPKLTIIAIRYEQAYPALVIEKIRPKIFHYIMNYLQPKLFVSQMGEHDVHPETIQIITDMFI